MRSFTKRLDWVIEIVPGDVQLYVALGRRLLQDGHRVRIATHGMFESFVREHGLLFFDIGGDPAGVLREDFGNK